MAERDTAGRWVKGHKSDTLTHSGAGAVRAAQRGEEYTGMAAQELLQVERDFDVSGRVAMQREIATRAHVLQRLYWNAVQSVTDKATEGDEDALRLFDSYTRRLGWLLGVAGRAWRDLAAAEADAGGPADVLEAALAAADEANTEE